MYNGGGKRMFTFNLSVSFGAEELDHPQIKYFKNMKL